jgi:hypothetical protein
LAEDQALLDLIKQFKRRKTRPLSTLGFFTIPFVADHGPYQGLVVKIYRGVRDQAVARHLWRIHENYVRILSGLGLPLPETRMSVVRDAKRHYPVVVQEPFLNHEILRNVILQASPERCTDLLLGALNTVFRFWDRALQQEELRGLGLHASIRNFGYRQGHFWHLDTFPPMFGLSRQELHELILQFAPSTACRLSKPLVLPFMDRVTAEYYDREENILGLIGSICRLRPECSIAFLQAAQQFADAQHSLKGNQAFLDKLDHPPRLSIAWISIRWLLGKEGEPNVKRFLHALRPTIGSTGSPINPASGEP